MTTALIDEEVLRLIIHSDGLHISADTARRMLARRRLEELGCFYLLARSLKTKQL